MSFASDTIRNHETPLRLGVRYAPVTAHSGDLNYINKKGMYNVKCVNGCGNYVYYRNPESEKLKLCFRCFINTETEQEKRIKVDEEIGYKNYSRTGKQRYYAKMNDKRGSNENT